MLVIPPAVHADRDKTSEPEFTDGFGEHHLPG
jgi:hypothetical protein